MRPTLFAFILLSISIGAAAHAELRPDQIALIVNKNSPDSIQLADFYVKARQIPPERVIALDLSDGDEITFDRFERYVLPEVRRFLTGGAPGLRERVTCLVSVYGVPLKIAARVNSPHDARELDALRAADGDVLAKLRVIADELERRASALDRTFRPAAAKVTAVSTADQLASRLGHVERSLAIALQRIDDPTDRQQSTREVTELLQRIRQAPPPLVIPHAPASTPSSSTTAEAAEDPAPGGADISKTDLADRQFMRFDPAARTHVRELAARDGLLAYARVLEAQVSYLTPDSSDAAFDSELALLWWPLYPRPQWMPNALHYEFLESRTPPVMMTMRLDAPTPQLVRDLILNSLRAERDGLKGRVVVDGGGAAKLDAGHKQPGFWPFEQHFIDLAGLVRTKAHLALVYDDQPDVLQPHTVKDVALYAGWYSVGQYVPSCTFSPGAVAYHVASYEMTSLHDPGNHGWCRGLLNDGAVATLGPVSEPYLHAFPLPDDFFALLLTGKMTLAEVYWHTTPLASWKMCMVGDPLYTPYRTNAPLKLEDLPEPLKVLFATRTKAAGPGAAESGRRESEAPAPAGR